MDTSPAPEFASLFSLRQNWRHLTRRPAHQEPVIDGVRALAILWVLLLHMVYYQFGNFPAEVMAIFNAPATGWIRNGTLGVDLFFVISGFLMGSILFGEYKASGALEVARFYARRFLRLIPVYLVVMAMGLYFLRGAPGKPVWNYAENFWANLLYVNNFLPVARQYMTWCWSLAIEEQFYLLLPACIILFMGLGQGRIRFLVGMMVLSVAIQYAVIHFSGIVHPHRFVPRTPPFYAWFDVIYDKPWMRFGGLLAGVAGAFLSCYHEPRVKRFFARKGLVTSLCVGCFVVIGHISVTGSGSTFFDRLPFLARELWGALFRDAFSLATMFLILAAMHCPALFGGALRRFLSWKGFYPIAQLSYSTYLAHEMFFTWLFPKTSPLLVPHLGNYGSMAVNAVIGLALSLVVASSLYVWIERPCMRIRSHPSVLNLIEFFKRPRQELVEQPQLLTDADSNA
jgi:peptidoglycan/LPS O-acetylase OafA/YrhL